MPLLLASFFHLEELRKCHLPPSKDVVRIKKDSIFEALGILLSLRNVRCGYQWLQRFKWFSSSLVFQGSISSWFIRRTFVDLSLKDKASVIVEIVATAILFMVIMFHCT